MPNSSRKAYLKSKFGITEEQWDKLYLLQGGLCPICFKELYLPGNKQGKRAAAVDHDHDTGRVRGLTCINCNRFKIARNTVESATRLVKYLDSSVDGRLL